MSDSKSDKPRPVRPATPPPARSVAGEGTRRPSNGAPDAARGSTSGGQALAPARPTPARDMRDDGAAQSIPVEEVEVLDGTDLWIARVAGRSGGTALAAPLTLVGFWRADDGSDPQAVGQGNPEREALVPVASLQALGLEGIRAAFASSRPSREAPRPEPPARSARPRRRGRGPR